MTTEERFQAIERHMLRMTEGMVGIAEAQDRTDGEIDRLVQTVSGLAETVGRIAKVQEQNEYKLNALIETVDKIVRKK
jgi:hypothetical protein